MIDYHDLMARVDAAHAAGPLQVKIADISHDVVTQIRDGIDQKHIARIQFTVESGGRIKDPLEIVRVDSKKNHLWDGWHRKEALVGAKCVYADAYVVNGTYEEAIALACSANDDPNRSLPRSETEELNAVKAFRKLFTDLEWAKLPVSAIADFCKLPRETVRDWVDSLPVLARRQDTKLTVTRTKGNKTSTYEMKRPVRVQRSVSELRSMPGAKQIEVMNADECAAILRRAERELKAILPYLATGGPKIAPLVSAIQDAINIAQEIQEKVESEV